MLVQKGECMDLKTVRSKTIFRGKVFDLRQDELRLPNGKTVALDIISHRGAVTIIPIDEQGQIWFIRQYRHAAGSVLLELPAGSMEENEAPEISAHREIREEIGMAARELTELGGFFLAPGYSTEFLHIYLARDLYDAPLDPDEEEMIEIEKIPVAQAYRLAEGGQISDAKTLASLLLARSHLLP
jgi:ADP-ribose pyrophosphatase